MTRAFLSLISASLVSPGLLVATLSLLGLAGCPADGPRPCQDDDQCEDNERCVIDDGDDVGVCTRPVEAGEGEGEGEGEGRATFLSVGGLFACAIDDQARVQCWGANSRGQLGRLTDGQRDLRPAPIPGLSEVTLLTTGQFHACAKGRLNGGQAEVYCWGESVGGTLGVSAGVAVGTLVPPAFPAGYGRDVISIGADGNNNDAITCATDGTDTFCFGNLAPDARNGLPAELDTLAGQAELVVDVDGLCGRQGNTTTCVHITASTLLANIGCADDGVCAALANGTPFDAEGTNICVIAGGVVRCGGENIFGVVDATNRAAEVLPLTDVIGNATSLVVGTQHACAIVSSEIRCWGRALASATGFVETDNLNTVGCGALGEQGCHGPQVVTVPGGPVTWVAVDGHRTTTCARATDGQVACFGDEAGAPQAGTLPHLIPLQ